MMCRLSPLLLAAIAVGIVLNLATPASAEDPKPRYPRMSPIEHYLIGDRNAEVALARSAAPDAISRDATVLVLGRHGFETAIKGTNGWVCLVERGWTSAVDWAELWNPKLKGPECLNAAASQSLVPIIDKKTTMVLAGDTIAQVITGLSEAFSRKELPVLAPGAMAYMMSKSAYLNDGESHNTSHVMFFTTLPSGRVWGADLPKSPMASFSFWFPNDENYPQSAGLPGIRIFIVGVKRWSDGTPQLVK